MNEQWNNALKNVLKLYKTVVSNAEHIRLIFNSYERKKYR